MIFSPSKKKRPQKLPELLVVILLILISDSYDLQKFAQEISRRGLSLEDRDALAKLKNLKMSNIR